MVASGSEGQNESADKSSQLADKWERIRKKINGEIPRCVSCRRRLYHGKKHICPVDEKSPTQEIDPDLFGMDDPSESSDPRESGYPNDDGAASNELLNKRLRDGFRMLDDAYQPNDEHWLSEGG